MSRKTVIMAGMIIGSFAVGYVATLLGAAAISFASLLGSTAPLASGSLLRFQNRVDMEALI
jgi:hypothetical protein